MPDLSGKEKDKFTIVIEGREIVVESAKFLRTMDTGADACNAIMPWEPGLDEDLDNITAPYSYSEVEVYIGGNLQMIGRLYNVTHVTNANGTVKELEMFSRTADILDSTILSPYEANNISLTDRCRQQCDPFGINVVIGDGVNLLKKRTIFTRRQANAKEQIAYKRKRLQELKTVWPVELRREAYLSIGTYQVTGRKIVFEELKFSRVSAKRTEKIFIHLSELAKQRGLLLSCTKESDLLITKANVEATPVGTIQEGEPLADEYKSKFNGRNRFSNYRAIASSSRSKSSKKTGIALDNVVKIPRYLTFNAGSNLPGQALNAADWKKNKVAADSMPTSFPINTIYAPNDELWEPNTTVTVISPTIGLKKGFTFLISKVQFDYKKSGIVAVLELKPPTVYTTGVIIEPWISD